MGNVFHVPYRDTGYFSDLICDYLDKDPLLSPFYNRFPNRENFKAQIKEKSSNYDNSNRKRLVDVLLEQYSNIQMSAKTQIHINDLLADNTFTITTGHQLNLFTGPLYFLYKIISTINLCKTLKARYTEYNFVPVYWMATEDHDFEEINHFNFQGKKVTWNSDSKGAVGAFSTEGLDEVYLELEKLFPNMGDHTTYIKNAFKNAYLNHYNLADATRYLANELFNSYGLVILDANDKRLKTPFIPYVENDLFKQDAFNYVTKTSALLTNLSNKNYPIQVNPREINLFYLRSNSRNRIVKSDQGFEVLDTNYRFTETEIKKELSDYPERFSPNVIMRPLYQDVILPNLCYIGGGGELAYWFQLEAYFKSQNVAFPIVLLRNSALVIENKQYKKMGKLNLQLSDLFLQKDKLIDTIVANISEINLSLDSQKKRLKQQFKELYQLAEKTDASFVGAVAAQERKQTKGLENLEKRLLNAQKRKHKDFSSRAIRLQEELFPNESLQERVINFSEVYLKHGDALLSTLFDGLDPLQSSYTIFKL